MNQECVTGCDNFARLDKILMANSVPVAFPKNHWTNRVTHHSICSLSYYSVGRSDSSMSQNKKYHALAAASRLIRKEAPKGARAWSRALPSFQVSVEESARTALDRTPMHQEPPGRFYHGGSGFRGMITFILVMS